MKKSLETLCSKIRANKFSLGAQVFAVIFILSILSIFVYKDIFNKPPQGVHAWSQSDHLAIAQTYSEGNLNIFKPRTYLLNPNNPPESLETLDGITRVDFPLSEYLVGVAMKLSGCSEPIVYRLFSLLVSLIGLLFLFKLLRTNTSSFWTSMLVPMYIYAMPVYMYYQCSFSPSTSAAALCFIGYYYYFLYLQKKQFKFFIIAGLFFFSAILFRLPFAIASIAVFCQQILTYLLNRKIVWKEFFVFASLFVLLLSYSFHNQYLQDTYGSIFLRSFSNVSSIKEFRETLNIIIIHHKGRHFCNGHIWCFFVLAANLLVFTLHSYLKKRSFCTVAQKQILLQSSIALFGGILYCFLMLKQYIYHDYYFVESFLVPFALLLVFLFSFIRWENRYLNCAILVICSISIVFAMQEGYRRQSTFRTSGNDGMNLHRAQISHDMGELLERNHITKDKTIAIFDVDMPGNLALSQVRRKGFGITPNFYSDILSRKWIKRSDYIMVSEYSWLTSLMPADTSLLNELEYVDNYHSALLFKYIPKGEKLSRKYQFDSSNVQLILLDFVKTPESYWELKDSTVYLPEEDKHVAYVASQKEYSTTLALPISKLNSNRSSLVKIVFDIMPLQENINPVLVFSMDAKYENLSYTSKDLGNDFIFSKRKWQTVEYLFRLSGVPQAEVVKFYLWNPKQNEFYYDNLKLYFF